MRSHAAPYDPPSDTKPTGAPQTDSANTKKTGDQTPQPGQQPAAQPPSTQPSTASAAPSGPKPGSVTVTGLVDAYYGVNFRNPGNPNPKSPYYPSFTGVPLADGTVIKTDNALRFNDINNRTVTLSLAEVDFVRTEDKRLPLGFHVTLTAGEEPLIFHATEPGGTHAWRYIDNLYAYHTFRIARRDVEVNAGIWASPFGIEVLESPQDDNYSRGILFVLSPFYHAGVRAKAPLTKKITLEAAVVNGWNDIADDNGVIDGYLQLTIKPNPRFTQVFSFIGGTDGQGPYGYTIAPKDKASIQTHVFDINSIYQITPRFKIAGWIDFGNGAGNSLDRHTSGSWLGLAAYARYQITKRIAIATRIEQFEDHPGAGGVGLRFGNMGYTKYREGTITLEYASFGGRLLSRLEYRHDNANLPLFGFGSKGAGKDQDTVYLSEAYKF